MLLSFVLHFTLLLPTTFGSGLSPTNDSVVNMLLQDNNRSKDNQDTPKISNVTIITEGGSPVQSTPIILPKKNLTIDTAIGKDKPLEASSSSKVKPRKGVDFYLNSTADDNIQLKKVNTTQDVKGETQAFSPPLNISTKPSVSPKNSKIVSKIHLNSSTEVVVTTTPKPKKPLVLSNEALDKMPVENIDFKTFKMSSDKNQVRPMSSSRHPGMVMPIVITILVVPMFAVLGYMALRRGREAWKNRHYKRMDFLLDGMYNE